MRNSELTSLLREKNKVRMPVNTADGEGVFLTIVKSDLEAYVKAQNPKAEAQWGVLSYKEGVLTLDPDI